MALTTTERKIAVDLANGWGVTTIADERRLSLETVRWHVRNLIDKLGARNLADLQRTLALLLPFLRPTGLHKRHNQREMGAGLGSQEQRKLAHVRNTRMCTPRQKTNCVLILSRPPKSVGAVLVRAHTNNATDQGATSSQKCNPSAFGVQRRAAQGEAQCGT